MKRKQAAKRTAGDRVRLTVYLPKDEAAQLHEFLEKLPFKVSVSNFAATAIKESIARLQTDGIVIPPR